MNANRISPQEYNDACPVHGGDLTKEYNFGMGDATVIKHSCGCCLVADDSGLNDMTYFRSYSEAVGLARLIVAKGSRDNKVFA